MRTSKRIASLAAVLLFSLTAVFPSGLEAAPQKERPVVVGRVAHIDGQILRYVYEEKDWVPILKDVPFGLEDSLYSDQDAKAEIVFPNSTWIRIGGSTQIQAIALDDEVTEIDVASGVARFYSRGSQSVIKATTPFGYVLAPGGTIVDLYVGDDSVEVIALKGTVDFVHAKNTSRYEVQSGASSLVADSQFVTSGKGLVDADFDDWNAQRDNLWAKRLDVKGDSTRYLPPQLADDAYEFEENGRWERVQYEGETRNLWRPTRVAPDWTPYSTGRWTTYYGDQCWVPYEPFGYTTHHYGSWVFIQSCRCWYWAPPLVTVAPMPRPWTVGYGWYPGRVSWIYSDTNVGWVPLAPYEPYYAQRYWGPSSVAVATLSLAAAAINLATLSNLDHAVFVGHRDFWGVDNYSRHIVRNVNRTTIINNYYASPVVDRRVIRDFDTRRDRYNFVNRDVTFKPHRTVVERIDQNQRLAARQERLEARALLRDTRNIRQGTLSQDARIERPRVTSRLVSRDSVDKPASELKFQQRELKRQERQQKAVEQRVLRQQQRDEQQQQRQQQTDDRRQMREERQPVRPERPDPAQRQQLREQQQELQRQQLEERRRLREEQRQADPAQRRQLREEERQQQQKQLEERRRLREEQQQMRPQRPDSTQRQQLREEQQQQRQQQLDERRQMREQPQQRQPQQLQERQQTRPDRPEPAQRQQLREEQQQQRQQQLDERRQMREQPQQRQPQQLQERQQTRPDRPEPAQRQQQREEQQQQRQQQLDERRQMREQPQQRQPQQLQERQPQHQQEQQPQQQPRDKRRKPAEEDQQPGARPQ